MSSKKLNADSVLWDQFREGDDQAFAQLFEIFSEPLFRYGMKFLNNQDLIKDCIQDLFIKLYSSRNKLSFHDNPRLFLYKSLKNELIDKLRQEKRQQISFLPPEDLHFSVEYYFDPEEEDEESSELKEKFEQVMSMLTDRQKEAIYLRYQTEMTYEEISQLLNINVQSVRNLIHRAIENIRSEMNLSVFLLLLSKCI